MKMKQKVISVLCILAMVIAMFTGCKKEKSTNDANTDASKPNENAEIVTGDISADEEETLEGKYDFGGRVFKIASWWDITPKEGVNEQTDAYIERIKTIEDAWNCKIEWVTVNDTSSTYITSTLSGEPVADIVRVLSYDLLPGFIEGGIAYPLSDLKAFNFDDYKWIDSVTNYGTYKGKVYCMDIKMSDDNAVRYGVFYNKSMFEDYNLPDLGELYANDEWTWDKMLEIAKQVVTDVDGDGVTDIYPVGGEYYMYNLIASNGADIVARTDTAAVVQNLNDPKVIEALDFGAKLNSEVLIGTGDAGAQFRDGQIAMAVLEWWQSGNFYTKDGIRQMNDNWAWVPFPKGPSATEYYSYGREISPYIMLKTCENPEDVAIVFNAITDFAESDEQWDEWLETKVEVQADDAATVNHVVEMINKANTLINPLQGFSNIFSLVNTMFDEVWNKTSTSQVALEAYASSITTAVEDAQNTDFNANYQALVEAADKSKYNEPTDGKALDTSTWTIEVYRTNDGDDKAYMIDGDGATRWANGEAQLPGTMDQWISVDLGSVQDFNRIMMWTPGGDTAKGYEVFVSEDNMNWTSVATGVASEYFTNVDFNNVKARYFRINQTGDGPTNYWSINELRVFLMEGIYVEPTEVKALDTSKWTIEVYKTADGDDKANMIDGDGATRWANGEAQMPGTMDQWVMVDLGSAQDFNRIMLWTPSGDAAKGYEVFVSEDGTNWTSVAAGIADMYFTNIDFDTTKARYFRINQTGDGPTNYWSINELRAFLVD
ncbi:hypothetical protein HNQ56_001395 [Anaerotaenia torta]|uniref:discoidin domain-containing protein n=1 Tax=Anaerotaenia torta TaxID=433293 RepID=UPI003D238BFC